MAGQMDNPIDGRGAPLNRDEMPRQNRDRPVVDQINLNDYGNDEGGWPYALLLGDDSARGWSFECDMKDGRLVAALTPADQDALFLLSAEETNTGPDRTDHTTTAAVNVDGAFASWDPEERCLTVWNGAAPHGAEARERLNKAAPEMLLQLREDAAQFRFYEQQHRAKGTSDADVKADTNRQLAERIEALIARAEGR